ncbi:unnamed protein product [Euphydryas editha]|uniref:Endonuclease-reverse transcriptase n=1 Tax=Euphydryas editha TaxID=104508 RepID=A0AAU9TP75_EUPED|nr:unnamed protein product [Euphydryas editha]
MDEIKCLLRNMQEEMRQQKADILDMKEDIKNTIISNMSEKFNSLEVKNEQLEQQLVSHKNKIESIERLARRRNLLFFGVEERERSYQDLENKVLDIINNMLNINCNEYGIETVRRLGKKGEKVRPIVVTLTTMGLKIKVLKNKKNLATSPYYIKEDFPLEVINKRKELQNELKKERELGNRAIIKYDKLIILNEKTRENEQVTPNGQGQKKKDNKKRNLSESPEDNPSSSKNSNKKQSTKINKNSSMSNYLIKKPTFTYHGSLSPQKTTQNPTQTTL